MMARTRRGGVAEQLVTDGEENSLWLSCGTIFILDKDRVKDIQRNKNLSRGNTLLFKRMSVVSRVQT